MKILITGGAGFLGARLARTLLARGQLRGRSIEALHLADLVAPPADLHADPRVQVHTGPLLQAAPSLAAQAPDAVFHLASAVSAECEADFELGLSANLDSTRALLDALRRQRGAAVGEPPLFMLASSVAVFGSDPALPLPDCVRDDTLPTPQSSYGTQKFMLELLVADHARKGFLDGRTARLMTVAVRPGRPNGAASGFLSGIVREPLAGLPAVCPVAPETRVALASPGTTIAGLMKVAETPRDAFGGRTAINLPALTTSVGDMLAALERVGGRAARERVRFEPDPAIARIVGGWPARFESARARRLGLPQDPDFDAVIAQYVKEHPQAVQTAAGG